MQHFLIGLGLVCLLCDAFWDVGSGSDAFQVVGLGMCGGVL